MIDGPENNGLDTEKLDALSARIRQAEGKPADGSMPEPKAMPVSGAGFEFLGSILGGTLLGWLIDHYLGTGPWGLVIMIFAGFAAGMVRVWKAMDSQGS